IAAVALAWSPSESARALLTSITPAPVFSRSALMSAAVEFAILSPQDGGVKGNQDSVDSVESAAASAAGAAAAASASAVSPSTAGAASAGAAVSAGLASSVLPSRRSEEHTSELQSRFDLVCRLLLEKKKSSEGRTSG